MPEQVKVEKWMEAVEEELHEQEFGFDARVRIMAILSRHYAARSREVKELLKVAENARDILAELPYGIRLEPRGELGSAKAINSVTNRLRAAQGLIMTAKPEGPQHPVHSDLAGPLYIHPAKPVRAGWWQQRNNEKACRKAGGHWWHPEGMIDWFCCQCGAETEGSPRDGQ